MGLSRRLKGADFWGGLLGAAGDCLAFLFFRGVADDGFWEGGRGSKRVLLVDLERGVPGLPTGEEARVRPLDAAAARSGLERSRRKTLPGDDFDVEASGDGPFFPWAGVDSLLLDAMCEAGGDAFVGVMGRESKSKPTIPAALGLTLFRAASNSLRLCTTCLSNASMIASFRAFAGGTSVTPTSLRMDRRRGLVQEW